MSTTRSTHNRTELYTVVGDHRPRKNPRLGLLLLNRGSRLHREDYLEGVSRQRFDEIVLAEPQENSYTVERLAQRFPKFRFLLFSKDLSPGEQINVALLEMQTPFVLVMWSTMELVRISAVALDFMRERQPVVLVPVLRGENGDLMPTIQIPTTERRNFAVNANPPGLDGMESLFPVDFVGLYCRERFFSCGGFDLRLNNPFWQKVDFGFRCHLWGERITLHTGLRFNYRSSPEPEDQTRDGDYALFFAKNLLVRIRNDGGYLSPFLAPGFSIRAHGGLFRGLKPFFAVKRWVSTHRYRFLRDARNLIREWPVDFK